MTSRLLHTTIMTSRLSASLAFYDAALGAVGIPRHSEFGDEEEEDAPIDAVGYGDPDGDAVLWVVAAATSTTGAHVALRAPDQAAVAAFYAAAITAGGTARQAPRRWAIFRAGYFGAVVADPDGNLVEAVAAE